jgi:hypothetical protein
MTTTNNTNNRTGRLGKTAKFILLLLLQGDEPQGCPNPIWFDLSREFKIDFGLLPKKYQPLKFRQERNLRRTLCRLTAKGFIKPSVAIRQNSSLVAAPKKFGYSFYSLTPVGRAVAEKVRCQELALKDLEALQEALGELRGLGYSEVTAMQIRDVLWRNSFLRFRSRAEFDAYWSHMRLGLLLQKCSCGRMRIGFTNRRWRYSLG